MAVGVRGEPGVTHGFSQQGCPGCAQLVGMESRNAEAVPKTTMNNYVAAPSASSLGYQVTVEPDQEVDMDLGYRVTDN